MPTIFGSPGGMCFGPWPRVSSPELMNLRPLLSAGISSVVLLWRQGALLPHLCPEHPDLRAPLHLQLGAQPRYGIFDGLFRPAQPGTNLPVGQSIGDQRQDPAPA